MTSSVVVDQNLQSAPEGAFEFDSSCQFAEPSKRDEKTKLRKSKVSLLARTADPVYHWYWGWVVHDMSGMKSPDRIALDYCHDSRELVGYADDITAKNELKLGGELISRNDDDTAAEIMDLGPAGVPYQASIQFNPYSVVLEYVPDQAKTTVNGKTVMGPLTIMREWELMRCAICPNGVDGGTRTKFSNEQSQAAQFSLRWKDNSDMSKNDKSNPGSMTPATQPEGQAGQQTQPATTPAAGQQSQPAVSTEMPKVDASNFEAEFRTKLKRYTDRFGAEHGAKYFADGLSYESALDQHCSKLEADLKISFTANEELSTKLSQLNLGEIDPVKTGLSSGKDGKKQDFAAAFRSRDAKNDPK